MDHGKDYIVIIIDQIRKKIIDFEVIRKIVYIIDFEVFVIIHGYAHDKDSSISVYMHKNWLLPKFLNRNHSIKCLSSHLYQLLSAISSPLEPCLISLNLSSRGYEIRNIFIFLVKRIYETA